MLKRTFSTVKFCLFSGVFALSMLFLSGCTLPGREGSEQPDNTIHEVDEAAILAMTPEEFEAYQKQQESALLRRQELLQKESSGNKTFSKEPYSVEKRRRLGNANDPSVLRSGPANTIFPWHDPDRRRSEILYEKSRERDY